MNVYPVLWLRTPIQLLCTMQINIMVSSSYKTCLCRSYKVILIAEGKCRRKLRIRQSAYLFRLLVMKSQCHGKKLKLLCTNIIICVIMWIHISWLYDSKSNCTFLHNIRSLSYTKLSLAAADGDAVLDFGK